MRTHRTLGGGVSAAVLALSLAAAPTMAGTAPPPEKITGSIGPYVIIDGPDATDATCRYTDSEPPVFVGLTVRPPKVYWPDTSSSHHHQHGRVAWFAIVEASTSSSGPWTRIARSHIEKAIAYEDGAAPFHKRFPDVVVPGHQFVRAASKVIWYRADGSVRGTLKHWYTYHRFAKPDPITEAYPCETPWA